VADVTITVDGVDRSGNAFHSAETSEKKLESTVKSLNSTGDKAAKALKDGLSKVGKEADNASDKTEKFGTKFKNAVHDQAKEGVDGLLGKLGQTGAVLGKLGTVGIAAGAALGAAFGAAALAVDKLKEALNIAIQRDMSNRKLAAQLGLDPAQMKVLGKVAGQVYADNFGDSIESINDTIKTVIQNLRGFTDDSAQSVKQMTEQVSVLMQTTGEDADAITRAASQLVRTGLVKNITEAFDLIQTGAQEGDDKAHDLLDTFNEYGTQFRKLGLDGKTALGLINQAVKAGARDSDVAADALKEFSIRAVDGSTTTAAGFKLIGLSAHDMAERVGKGGKSASDALQLTLDRIKAIKDPVKQSQAAVALFGTQAEDLGAALYAMNIPTATGQMGDFAGATKKASDTMSGGLGATFETMKRKVETLKAQLGEKLMPVVQYFIDHIWPKLGAAVKIVADKFQEFWQKAGPGLLNMLHNLEDTWNNNKASIEKLKPFLEWLGTFLGVTLVAALIVVGGLIGLFIEYLGNVGDTLSGAKKGFDVFAVDLLVFFGRILDGAVAAFGWIPGIGPKLKAAQNQFHKFAAGVISDIEGIPEQRITTAHVELDRGSLYATRDTIARVLGSQVVSVGLNARGHASGGIAGGLSRVGERGEELIRLPQGSMVYPHANTQLMNQQAQSQAMAFIISIEGSNDDWLYAAVKEAFRLGKVKVKQSSVIPG
jgi:phage-related minor tail protein